MEFGLGKIRHNGRMLGAVTGQLASPRMRACSPEAATATPKDSQKGLRLLFTCAQAVNGCEGL